MEKTEEIDSNQLELLCDFTEWLYNRDLSDDSITPKEWVNIFLNTNSIPFGISINGQVFFDTKNQCKYINLWGKWRKYRWYHRLFFKRWRYDIFRQKR